MRRFLTTLLPVLLLVAACGSADDDDGGADAGGGQTVDLVATDFAFDPADVTVENAGETTFTVSNEGEFPHALEVEGNGIEEETDELGPGESGSLTVELEPGEYVVYCPVGDHRDRGMEGTLVVGGGAAAGSGTTTGETESESDDPYGYG